MELLDVIILGFVQGVTEFLPISSTGHLVLVRELLVIDGVNALAIDAILHFATTAAVMVYFRHDLLRLVQVAMRKLGRLPVEQKDMTLLYALMIGTIPAVVAGLLLESVVSTHLRTAAVVAVILFSSSLFFLYAEWRYSVSPPRGQLTLKRGLLIGLFQMLALLPGMSRSGATIAGGMLMGLTRIEATRFSFLLAIPITLGVGAKMTLDLMGKVGEVTWGLIAVGAVVAFVTALTVIHFFLAFIRKYTLWPFVWYGIILAGFVGYVALIAG
jgi:undecaprenyl-diphosphatase